jgi:hypothetical protein
MDKGLISRVYKELKKLNSKRKNVPINKWANELSQWFSEEDVQIAKNTMNKCSASLAIKKMQIKSPLRFHLSLVRMIIIKKTKNSKC